MSDWGAASGARVVSHLLAVADELPGDVGSPAGFRFDTLLVFLLVAWVVAAFYIIFRSPWARASAPQAAPPEVSLEGGPIEAFRGWRVVIGVMPTGEWQPTLTSAVADTRWHAITDSAVCNAQLREGAAHPEMAAPVRGCSCGFHGVSDPEKGRVWAYSGWPAMGASGRVRLSGRILEQIGEYRAERAEVVGPLTVRIGCDFEGCVFKGDFVVARDRELKPSCTTHIARYANGADRVLLAGEFAPELCARLAQHYGVPVIAG